MVNKDYLMDGVIHLCRIAVKRDSKGESIFLATGKNASTQPKKGNHYCQFIENSLR